MGLQLPRMQRQFALTDKDGKPSQAFQIWWQLFARQIEQQEVTQGETIAGLAAAVTDIATAQADIIANQAGITALGTSLAGYVAKDQAAAPAYTVYAGQTVSNPPTQAQVQALDNAVVTLSAAFAGLRAALITADVLT